MRDDDHGHAGVRQLLHDVEHLADHLGVERGCRLVEQHDLRLHHERAHDGHTLLLAAGELDGIGVGTVLKADTAQQLQGLFRGHFTRHTEHLFRRQRHILQDGPVREEVEMLEDHAHLPAQLVDVDLFLRDIDAVEQDRSARRRLQQVQAAQERALAGAGGADGRDDIALPDIDGDAVQRADGVLFEILAEILHGDDDIICGRHGSFSFRNTG